MLINDALTVFRQGKALANASLWANSTASAAALAGVFTGLLHLARALGYDLSAVTDAQLESVAGGVASLVCVVSAVLHVACNPNAGLSPAAADSAPSRAGPGVNAEPTQDRI